MTTHVSPAGTVMDDSCLFCKIIAGAIPCARVYEDEKIFAFLDRNPISKGHTLVVPKGHFPTLLDLPETEGAALVRAMKLIAKALQEERGAGGFNCIQNNFAPAGQVIFHSHWHIVPRFADDGLSDWPGGEYADIDEMQQLARSINARIA